MLSRRLNFLHHRLLETAFCERKLERQVFLFEMMLVEPEAFSEDGSLLVPCSFILSSCNVPRSSSQTVRMDQDLKPNEQFVHLHCNMFTYSENTSLGHIITEIIHSCRDCSGGKPLEGQHSILSRTVVNIWYSKFGSVSYLM